MRERERYKSFFFSALTHMTQSGKSRIRLLYSDKMAIDIGDWHKFTSLIRIRDIIQPLVEGGGSQNQLLLFLEESYPSFQMLTSTWP